MFVADVTAGARLDELPVASNWVLGDGDVVSSLCYILGVCPAALHDKHLVCEFGKPFTPGQPMRCRLQCNAERDLLAMTAAVPNSLE